MKKFAILTLLSMMSLSSVSFAEEQKVTSTEKSVTETQKKPEAVTVKPQKNVRRITKGTGMRAMARFNKMDANKDGKISQSEFTAFQNAIFTQKDRNKDGDLIPAELSPTLAKIAVQSKN
jgi:hypothetical protein